MRRESSNHEIVIPSVIELLDAASKSLPTTNAATGARGLHVPTSSRQIESSAIIRIAHTPQLAAQRANDRQISQGQVIVDEDFEDNRIEALTRLTNAAKAKNRPNPEAQARTNLIPALVNHNDFVTVR